MANSKAVEVLAAALALALPLSFYTFGDLVDAFPGVLTVRTQKKAVVEGVPAEGESWERTDDERPYDAVSPAARVGADQINTAIADLPQLKEFSGKISYAVVDAESGETIAEHGSGVQLTPASTMKLLSALAAAKAIGPDTTFTTRAVL
ncbi:MAG: D-alanyl-D-alanine carboxypeptidase, partial [Dermabacter sp.]|nr:D-alanyl-D-alanine carboxypeptidase [Dermabacter sp.]